MKKRLVLTIQDKILSITLGLGKMPVAQENGSCQSLADFKELLHSFMQNHAVKSDEIKHILFVMDFTHLLPRIKQASFGYIQIGGAPSQEQAFTKSAFPGIELDIPGLNLITTDSEEEMNYLLGFLKVLESKNISQIAINNAFSTFNEEREKEIIRAIRETGCSQFEIFSSHRYSVFNYKVRENMLFLNLILHKAVREIIGEMQEVFYTMGLNCPIYFMRGNGTLTDMDFALSSPSFCWQSLFASRLMGASALSGETDSFVLMDDEAHIRIGMVQNGIPSISEPFSYFHNLSMPASFPWTALWEKTAEPEALKQILDEYSPFPGPIPVISFSKSVKNSTLYPYDLIQMENHPAIEAIGALNALFQIQISSSTHDMHPEAVKRTKEMLREEAERILKKHNISLKNTQHHYEIIPITYNLQNTGMIRLRVRGEVE